MQSTYDQIRFYKLTKKEKEEIIKKIKGYLAEEKRIKLAIIFGSLMARDYVRDIGICISSNPKLNLKELLELNAKIELEIGIPIDMVEMEMLPKILQTDMLKKGVKVKG
ncbi:MAG: hypothetical protein ACPL0C_07235 [Candidatus Bathyarchaeales archaeon]